MEGDKSQKQSILDDLRVAEESESDDEEEEDYDEEAAREAMELEEEESFENSSVLDKMALKDRPSSPPCHGFSSQSDTSEASPSPKKNDLKIKIKFGKIVQSNIKSDKFGKVAEDPLPAPIVESRRESKDSDNLSEESEIELPGAPVTATLSEAEVSAESSPVCSPVIPPVTDFTRPFHGWSREMDPRAGLPWVEQDYSKYDLVTPFTLVPALTIAIGAKNKLKSPGEKSKKPSLASPTKVTTPIQEERKIVLKPIPVPLSPAKKGEIRERTPSPKKVMPSNSEIKRDKKKSKNPNLMFWRPLEVGWVREIVFRDEKNGKADVFYWPPVVEGQKHKKYKSANELEGYLITSGSMYALSFFTFKKEAIGAPEGQEIIRYASGTPKSAEKSKKSREEFSLTEGSGGLGKRVSKPPEKLLLEIEKASTPKEKTPAPTQREKTPAPKEKTLKDMIPVQKLSTDSTLKTGNLTESPRQSASTILKNQLPAGKGLLKVKMFGKMKARNQMTGSNSEAEEDKSEDTLFLDANHPPIEKNPPLDRPPVSSMSMTVTKVKKPIITPQGITIRPTSQITQIPQQQQPSLTIRPAVEIRPVERSPAGHIRMLQSQGPPRLMPSHVQSVHGPVIPGGDIDVHVGPGPKIVRPSKSTQLPCSIHCPGVSGFPSLSCTSCHCLFHPKCVGLPGYLGHSSQYQFFCNDCHPEGRENDQQHPSPSNQMISQPKQKSPRAQQEQTQRINSKNSAAPPSNKPQEVRSALKESNRIEKLPSVPRPIEAQMMVNIGGHKFLVIPHPAPVVMDSPPPSPPPTVRGIKPVEKKPAKKQKLPVLLTPGPDTPLDVPSFEVEQAADGTLQLIPLGNALDKNPFGASTRKRKNEDGKPGPAAKSWCSDFTNNLSSGYFAMTHVFKYLTVKERLLAARVCRLWWNMTYHSSLWEMVSLKNTRVYDWRGFGQFLNKTKSNQLDLRKLLFVKDRDATWAELINIAVGLVHLTKIQLPRLSGSILTELVTTCPKLEVVHAPLTSAPIDLSQFSKMSHLRELKLKAGIGILKVENGTRDLDKLAGTLTHLSLLTLDGLAGSDFDVFGSLVNLESLELGDCSQAPDSLFDALSKLPKLERLRLEKGAVGGMIAKLACLEKLLVLELIDFQVELGFQEGVKTLTQVKKLLLIPTYRDEVAAVNAEIVDGITKDMRHLTVFCLGVTNEWLEAMAAAVGGGKKGAQEKDCFPIVRSGKADLISLPALYRLMCREMPKTKVKVLKMSAQATCKQFISILESKS